MERMFKENALFDFLTETRKIVHEHSLLETNGSDTGTGETSFGSVLT